jgi:transcriptional regulator with XRE-family HTH domain
MAKALTNLLRDLRESNGKTLRQTAKDLDVNPAYLSRVERGEKPASRAIQHRLAAYYEVEPEVIEVAIGQLPPDVVQILQAHPDAIEQLREKYGAS